MSDNSVIGYRSEVNYPTSLRGEADDLPDIVCLSRLRWDFAGQRPQRLMSRSALERRVFFVEEPVFGAAVSGLDIRRRDCSVFVVTPHLREESDDAEAPAVEQALLLDELFLEYQVCDYILWYYTPTAVAFTWRLDPLLVVYDCMDEPSAFKSAPTGVKRREAELLKLADVVFTRGYGLYKAKRRLHHNVHPFPDGVDLEHFRQARRGMVEPVDQARIGRPRLGFSGVIDERLDWELLAAIAEARPNWQIVMIGPVVEIDPAELPRRRNIHYLGDRSYKDLPAYFSGWDVAVAPFARNESTKLIAPAETSEYLAAGVPTVSTSIRDVELFYGRRGLVKIADATDEFVAEAERLMNRRGDYDYNAWLDRVDETLASSAWDETWARMMNLIDLTLKKIYFEGRG
jgi:glycosyltransferase involved in cell wall biosynthesis